MSESVSLRAHLLRQLLVPLTLVFLCGGGLSYYAALHYAAQEYNRTLYDMVHSLARLVRVTPSHVTLDLPEAAEKLFLWDDVDVTYYRVWGERSGQIAGYPELAAAGDAENVHGVLIGSSAVHGEVVRVATLTLPAVDGGETVYVRVGETQRKRSRLTQTIVLGVLLPQLILVLLVLTFVGRGIRRGLEPLRALAVHIESRSPDDRSPVSVNEVPQEVETLVRALDALLGRLDTVMTAQRNFVADTAHQLRTPLAAIRLNLERAQAQDAPQEIREALAAVRISAERAVRLSNQLLALARLDDAGLGESLEIFDLRDLARETGAEWVTTALHHNVDLAYESCDAAVPVRGNRHLFRELLSNLIDNAIKHGRNEEGSAVVLSVERADGKALLKVTDNGPGIEAQKREHVLKRYSRGDSGGQGAGLGLAIAAEATRKHSGQLKLTDSPSGTGLTVLLELPLAE
ncbi:MAG: sensor histidine kinase [Cupriavidus sp.]|nr:MAG: sensor histidine kinase [Cupriavidus sp.]